MTHGRQTPGRDRNGVTDFGSVLVNQPTKDQQADSIGSLESRVDHPKLGVGPMQLFVENGLQQGKNLPVDIVDGGGKEQQGADGPAVTDEFGDEIHVFGSFLIQCFSMAVFKTVVSSR